jgi:general secretion pathway protein A
MYCNHFGFSEKPFDVTPDPKFLYLSPNYQEILASVIYGIQQRRGFISIIGEVGTGKTMLINAVLEKLGEEIKVAFIFNTDMTFKQLLVMVLMEFGLVESMKSLTKADALYKLNQFAIDQFSKGGNVVLIVDEAQNLSKNSLENLRLLSNIETPKHKLVQIVLSGQPELALKLSKPELRQLSQRISLKRYPLPFDEEQTYQYIAHRLSIANYRGSPLFDGNTLKLIWEHSKGTPRKINILCDNALLIGYALGKKSIEKSILLEAIRDLSDYSDTLEFNAADEIDGEDSVDYANFGL